MVGQLALYGIFTIEAIVHEQRFGPGEDGPTVNTGPFLVVFGLIIALFTQVVFIIPTWKRFKKGSKVFHLPIIPFFVIVCLIGGTAFGFLMWNILFGISDLIIGSTIGIISFAVYWVFNLFALIQLDKWAEKQKQSFY